eukprot:scaffold21193_cov62-Phaeocystis_antarctica.AAC.3
MGSGRVNTTTAASPACCQRSVRVPHPHSLLTAQVCSSGRSCVWGVSGCCADVWAARCDLAGRHADRRRAPCLVARRVRVT